MEDALYNLLNAITDLGDTGVLTLLVAVAGICLLAQGCRREAAILILTYLATIVVISLAKVLVMGCGSTLRYMGLHSPSGHSALSIAVYGCLAFLLHMRLEGRHRNLPLYLLFPLAFMIAATRVMLGFHTVSEVCVGTLIGALVLVVTALFLRKQKPRPFNPYVLIFASLLAAFVAHGVRLPAENIIMLLAEHLGHLAHCRQ